jgi:ectoine hydroxylase-related dioxygenase (phytanoyl-CoA dioxygenase family)
MCGELGHDGHCIIRRVFSCNQTNDIRNSLISALTNDTTDAVRRSDSDEVFAARNVLDIWPPACEIWRVAQLTTLLRQVLGDSFGLVRGLFFDKPPEHTWSLPWHKDMTLAVRNNQLPTREFKKPTTKVGVPHIEGSEAILRRMLTLRIHLDAATLDNGALYVIPGSHLSGKKMDTYDRDAFPIIAEAGDVLAIRPLVSHCSGKSKENTRLHRRILHLEFAADQYLPEGFEWYWFIKG